MTIALRGLARKGLLACLMAAGLALAGCSSSDPFAGQGSPRWSGNGPMPKGGGRAMIGQPYKVAGLRFVPRLDPDYDKRGVASWYGSQFHARMTSNGEWFDMEHLTAAHATMPLPSYAKVTNLENGRQIVVRVNDRGPFVDDRIIDMSKKSAEVLGFKKQGTAKVRVQYIGPAPTNDKGDHLMAMNEELQRGTPLKQMIASADANLANGGQPMQVAEAQPAPQPQQPSFSPNIEPAADSYFVQAGLFANPDNAQRAQAKLIAIGPVQIQPINGNTGTYYRVRLGPLPSTDQALAALAEAHAAGMPDARILTAQN